MKKIPKSWGEGENHMSPGSRPHNIGLRDAPKHKGIPKKKLPKKARRYK